MDAIFGVVKPAGCTSAEVVARIKRALGGKGKKPKVGHGGTLDPLATGVLVIGVGRGCKMLQGYLSGAKTYRATGVFGSETDTQDSQGKETARKRFNHVTESKLEAVLGKFTGEITQAPSRKRLYELARAGVKIDVPARKVVVHKISVWDVPAPLPHFGLLVECRGGTYIRTLIHEIGHSLYTCAHMTTLVRTCQGPFELENCLTAIDDRSAIVAHMAQGTKLLELKFEPLADDREGAESQVRSGRVQVRTERSYKRKRSACITDGAAGSPRQDLDLTDVPRHKRRRQPWGRDHSCTGRDRRQIRSGGTTWNLPDEHWSKGSSATGRKSGKESGAQKLARGIFVHGLGKLTPKMVCPPGASLRKAAAARQPLSPRPSLPAQAQQAAAYAVDV
jgi:tRNA pseudouridine55 synthase